MTGVLIEQLETYAPEVLASFRELASTGQVEFLAETYSHSLACMGNRDEFTKQVDRHRQKIEECFGIKPVAFRNTEMVYSDQMEAGWLIWVSLPCSLKEQSIYWDGGAPISSTAIISIPNSRYCSGIFS